ncbi:arginase family protein [Celerinatantimonas sp. MCCC 1A17872]|uniref:arginase family protein n=1 Tax=Celerinatantimonas sp. MCCC 1A17872 TaxID=3177514 RepID=UPI0038CBD896
MSKTLRLNIPQWQGGDMPAYHFGAQLLAWLAPQASGPVENVDVRCVETSDLENENGIVGRSEIIPQLQQTRELIDKHQPDSLVILGGDCLVDLVPFAYLHEKYGHELGILWVDAHPDIMTSQEFEHSHASVLRVLMGEGDADLTQFVQKPISSDQVMYAGVNEENDYEANFLAQRQMRICRPEEIHSQISSIQQWIKEQGIKYLAIHLDLDVLSIADFGSLLFTKPDAAEDEFAGIAQGKLTMADVVKVTALASAQAKVVGMGITEHLPWDSLRLKQMLEKLPLLGNA